MPYDELLIAPFREGKRKDVESWLLPNEAFDDLENVYLHRGVLQKRRGYKVYGQMGTFVSAETGFSNPGGNQYTKTLANTPIIAGSLKVYDDGGPQALYDDGSGTFTGNGTGTIDYTTGAVDVTFTGAIVGNVDADYHYSDTGNDRKIRGLFNLENSLGDDKLVACDRDCLSVYDITYGYFANKSNGANYIYFGNTTELFHARGYKSKLYLTDGIDSTASSGMWTYDPSTDQVSDFTAQYGSGGTDLVNKCTTIIPYYRRLLLIRTVEGVSNTDYKQRIRWSKIDDPTTWRADIPGQGSGLDAATNEEIVGAGIIHDVLVVALERSIWLFEYTGGYTPPFRWRRIKGNLEINAIYGTIETEQMVIFIGHGGIYACDGVNVQRLDDKIPDFTIEDINIEYFNKVCAVYDRGLDQVLISYPSTQSSTENDRTLAFGLKDGWFAEYNFGMHALGSYIQITDQTFADLTDGTTLWGVYSSFLFQELTRQAREDLILGGKDAGYVYGISDDNTGRDYPSDTATSYNFNIESKRFTPYVSEGIKARLSHIDFFVTQTSTGEVSLDLYENENIGSYATKTLSFDGNSDKIWKRINVSHNANAHKFRLYLTSNQLADSVKGVVRPRIHAIKLSFKPVGKLRLS